MDGGLINKIPTFTIPLAVFAVLARSVGTMAAYLDKTY